MSYNENVITKTHKLISRFANMYIKCMATDVLVCVLDKLLSREIQVIYHR